MNLHKARIPCTYKKIRLVQNDLEGPVLKKEIVSTCSLNGLVYLLQDMHEWWVTEAGCSSNNIISQDDMI